MSKTTIQFLTFCKTSISTIFEISIYQLKLNANTALFLSFGRPTLSYLHVYSVFSLWLSTNQGICFNRARAQVSKRALGFRFVFSCPGASAFVLTREIKTNCNCKAKHCGGNSTKLQSEMETKHAVNVGKAQRSFAG